MRDDRTKLTFDYEEKTYTLAFTAETLKRLEKSGFSFGSVENHVLTAAEDLFMAAFNAHHPDVKPRMRREIFKDLSENNADGLPLADILFEMVGEAIDELKPKGNVQWRVEKG